jgi:putative FmdB family regulatory protein
MPMYEFVCSECGYRFERLAGAGTERETCPQCGSAGAKRVPSSIAPPARLVVSPGRARKMEDKRGTDRGGARERFRKQRAKEKKRAGG